MTQLCAILRLTAYLSLRCLILSGQEAAAAADPGGAAGGLP